MTPERLPALAALALAALGCALAGGRPRLGRLAAHAAAGVLVVGLAWRCWRSGHAPVFGTYETSLAETALFLGALPWIERRAGASLARGALAIAAATLAHALTVHPGVTPLTISEQSLWIDAHAILAWLAWALYLHGGLCAARGEALEPLALRLLGLGFCAHSALGFAGIYYASMLFARPWAWDPVQTLGLLSWLLVAFVLHQRLFGQLSLHRHRRLVAFVLVVFVVSAKAMPHLPAGRSFHVFELGAMADER